MVLNLWLNGGLSVGKQQIRNEGVPFLWVHTCLPQHLFQFSVEPFKCSISLRVVRRLLMCPILVFSNNSSVRSDIKLTCSFLSDKQCVLKSVCRYDIHVHVRMLRDDCCSDTHCKQSVNNQLPVNNQQLYEYFPTCSRQPLAMQLRCCV